MTLKIIVGILLLVLAVVVRLVGLSAEVQIRSDLEGRDPEVQRRSVWLHNFYLFVDLKKHTQLFPESRLAKRVVVCGIFFFVAMIAGAVTLIT